MTEVRLRHVMRVNPPSPVFNQLPDDAELTFLPMEAVWPGDRLDRSQVRSKSAVSTGYTRFQDSDVLVPKITPTFEASRSVLIDGLTNGAGAGTTELHVLRAGPLIDLRYLLYITHSYQFLKLGQSEMYGVAGQKRVPDDFVRNYVIDLPSLEEQRRIAGFLDAETIRIDRLSSLRSRWIETLRTRWVSALERELLRASSIDVELRRLLRQPPQYGAQQPGDSGEVSWPRYIRITDLTERGELREDDIKRLQPELAKPYMLKDGDILLARSGATVGKGCRYRSSMGPACFAGYLIRVRQYRIVKRATEEKAYVDSVESRAARQVALLSERRQALIAAAVTGQIDVATAPGVEL